MNKNSYIFTIVGVRNNRSYTTVLSPVRIVLLLAGILVLCCFVVLPIYTGIWKVGENLELRRLANENVILRQSFSSWDRQVETIQDDLAGIYKRNEHMHTLLSTDVPGSPYGVGGPSSPHEMSLLNLPSAPEAGQISLALAQLESEVDWVSRNVGTLEESVFSRINEIAHYPSIKPVTGGWFSSFFGKRVDPFTGEKDLHPGLDISLPIGSKVYATADGIVKEVHTKFIKNKGYGKYIIIDHGYGFQTLYGHLSAVNVRRGQKIKRWDVIAQSGDTGKSTAPHLHYGIYSQGVAQNPMYFILQ